MTRNNSLAAVKGKCAKEVDGMKDTFENRTSQEHHVETGEKVAFISPSSEMDQGDHLVAINGYLESNQELTEEHISEMYAEHGENLPVRLNGSFRILIYDKGKEQLHAFADKAGRKVLYHTDTGRGFICSSHLTPILRHPYVDIKIDKEGMRQFLQSWSVSFAGGPRLLKDVERLHPSHLLTRSDRTDISKYWDVYDTERNVSDSEAVSKMDELLDEAADTLVESSEGSVNIFLSGGFDSVFLTNLISERTDRDINSYTWGWKDSHFSDAEMMAERLGTNQHSLKLDYSLPTKEDIWFYEEPQNAFVRYPFKELYQEHGLDSYWTGLNSQATFPVCLKNIRKLDMVKPVERLLDNRGGERLQRLIGDRISYKASKGIYVLRSDNYSTGNVVDWGLRGDDARDMLSDELRSETHDIEEVLDKGWELRPKSYQENYSYLQLRARDTARYAYYSQQMEHIDIFGYTPLLEYSYSLPMSQKKNRRLLQKIANERVPDQIITKGASGWEFVSEQFKQKIIRNREEYEKTVERFIDRGYVDAEKTRELLIDRSYENAGKGVVNQMIAVFLLEKWIETMIETDEPWKNYSG